MTTNEEIQPDTKDWTWVLSQRCPECGFTATDVAGPAIGGTVRDLAPRWVSALNRPDARVRPAPTTWSPLEYGAHVRDAFIVYGTRVASMRHTDNPLFPDWNQDETALAERYWEQEPDKVADELAVEGERLTGDLDEVAADEWQRRGRRSDGSEFTIDSLVRYLLHDVVHHLHDVGRG